MNIFSVAVATLILSTMSATAQSTGGGLFDKPANNDFQGQDIDANVRLLEALTRAAKKGPKFRISPDKVFMTLVSGEASSQTIRVSNVGDEAGSLNGVNSVGSVPGFELSDNCPDILAPGAYCDVAIRFSAVGATTVQTAILISMTERDRSSFDVPVQIEVTEPAVEELIAVVNPVDLKPVIIIKEPDLPKGPTASEVASRYFASMGGRYETHSDPRIAMITKPDTLTPNTVYGSMKADISIESEFSDSRYDPEIAAVDASLPVNRDKILTSDRVIKAVLDTPISNVMCGKVVAIIESDVYSATSAVPLIQAGSKAIGSCGAFAEERVGVSWSRILTTDGRSISLSDDATFTNDASGLGGGLGRVYRSNFDRFVLPIFSTMIDTTAGVIFATFGEEETVVTQSDGSVIQSTSAANEGLRLVTEGARGTSQELIAEIKDTREVMVLPAGSRIDIELSEDVYFKDSRNVVRLGDASYRINESEVSSVDLGSPGAVTLIPYQPGMEGPVVVHNGIRYVVSETVEPIIDEDGNVINPELLDLLEETDNADR
jgi:hypothetical protein